MNALRCVLLLASGLALAASSGLGAPPPVDLPGTEYRVTFATTAHAPDKWPKDPAHIAGRLFVPAGAGPHPAVVFLHGCAGIGSWHVKWAARLVGWGYAVLIADSFGPRGIQSVCARGDWVGTVVERPRDAYGALQYLQNRPDIDPDRIGLMGWSHGGATVLNTVHVDRTSSLLVHPKDERVRFKAAIAIYPHCGTHVAGIRAYAPLLVLVSELDDWTPPEYCRAMAAAVDANGQPVTLVVYPGAYHSFDAAPYPFRYLGHHLEPNPAAEADAVMRVRAFLAAHL